MGCGSGRVTCSVLDHIEESGITVLRSFNLGVPLAGVGISHIVVLVPGVVAGLGC